MTQIASTQVFLSVSPSPSFSLVIHHRRDIRYPISRERGNVSEIICTRSRATSRRYQAPRESPSRSRAVITRNRLQLKLISAPLHAQWIASVSVGGSSSGVSSRGSRVARNSRYRSGDYAEPQDTRCPFSRPRFSPERQQPVPRLRTPRPPTRRGKENAGRTKVNISLGNAM